MKTPALLAALVLLPLLQARGDEPLRVTSRVLSDGTMLTTTTNPETRTREERVTMAASLGEQKTLRRTVYTLNEQNFATGATHYDSKDNVRYKEVYTFDYTGRISESKLYDPAGQPLGKRVFVYDQKDKNQARIVDYDVAGNLITAATKGRSGQPEVRRALPVK